MVGEDTHHGGRITWSYTQQKMSTEQVGANEGVNVGANDLLGIIMDHPGINAKQFRGGRDTRPCVSTMTDPMPLLTKSTLCGCCARDLIKKFSPLLVL